MANVISSVAAAPQTPVVPVLGGGASPSSPPIAVAAVPPVAPVIGTGSGGNRSPSGDDALPGAAAAAQPDVLQLAAAVAGVNRFLRDSQRQILFQFDPHSGKESVTIVNPATGEVIRQIPTSKVIATAQSLQQGGILLPGLFIDADA